MAIVGVGNVTATGKVVFGYSFTPVAPVDSVDAGNAQAILCSSMVVLTGTVEGGVNNVFFWEQQSGTPVTIDDPTSLTTFFLNAGGSDIVIRLWVDKGLDTETYDDVEIVRTPSSWNAMSGISVETAGEAAKQYDQRNWKYYAAQRAPQQLTFEPSDSNWPPPEDANDGLSCSEISATTIAVVWKIPEDVYPSNTATYTDYLLADYVSMVFEKYNTGNSTWELVSEFVGVGVGVPRQADMIFGELYRLGAKYDYSLNPVFIQYTEPFYVLDDPTQLYKTPWSNNTASGVGQILNNVVSLKRITSVVVLQDDDFASAGGGTVFPVPVSLKRLVALTIYPPQDDFANAGIGIIKNGTFTVTRSNGGSIGG